VVLLNFRTHNGLRQEDEPDAGSRAFVINTQLQLGVRVGADLDLRSN
jgi:hypothetical protein